MTNIIVFQLVQLSVISIENVKRPGLSSYLSYARIGYHA